MSFILEALKKSDKKRQADVVPKLETEHKSAVEVNKRPVWQPLFVLFLLLNAVLLVWLLGPWQQSELAVERPVVEKMSTVTPVGEAVKKPTLSTSVEVKPLQVQSLSQPVIAEPIEQVEAPSVAASRSKVYTIADLPETILARLPELHMALHAFSKDDPAASLVQVNGQILRVGSALNGGFTLSEINEDGAVFSYKGYQFLLPR